MKKNQKYILWFEDISKKDVPLVGGKNASLGEMFSQLSKKGICVPDGFALTSRAFWYYLKFNKINEQLREIFKKFNPKNLESLQKTGSAARNLILKGNFPEDLEKEIIRNYSALGDISGKARYKQLSAKYKEGFTDVAVRSSATAEDLATASFAGQHETFLNVSGNDNLLAAIKKCFASLFTDRAISYREEKGFKHLEIALSAGIQKMVRSDLASSGVIFTLDTETGFSNVVLINSIWGVGEMIVKGKITPDEFYIFKPTLRQSTASSLRAAPQGKLLRQVQGKSYKPIIIKNLGRKTKKYCYAGKGGLKEVAVSEKDQLKFSLTDEEVLTLAQWAVEIERHYGKPQDIEWAKDGKTGQLFIVQSRPETIHTPKEARFYEEYQIKTSKKPILTGSAIGNKIGSGKVKIIPDIAKIQQFQKGEVLVTKMTDPDWVSVFPLASAIVTDEGGPTCHAAIVSRELGIPCIVGTGNGTRLLKNAQQVTVDCTQGKKGRVFEGQIRFKIKRYDLKKIFTSYQAKGFGVGPKLKTKIAINIGAPEIAFKTSFLPNDGVGLAREEFIIAEKIKVHPLALYHYGKIKNHWTRSGLPGGLQSKIKIKYQKGTSSSQARAKISKIIKEIEDITVEHKDKREFFVKELAEGVAQIAAAFYPKEVIVRFSDFKTNEYRNLVGGEMFEEEEPNPMIGFRGACRYLDKNFQPAFGMECQAIKRVREEFGLKNVAVMIPFCRTVKEGQGVIELMKKFELEQGKDGLKVYVMCEIPSNVILAEKFLEIFDGMSIGSNDLTQLVLGIDRDNARLSYIGDERNEAVKEMIKRLIEICRKKKKYVGICGQAPSDYPEFAEFLIKEGIESISLNPDAVIKTILNIAKGQR